MSNMSIRLESKNGFSAIQEIIEQVGALISKREENNDVLPRYIFRGITRYDSSFENGTRDIDEWTIRSGLAIRMSDSYSEGFTKNDFVGALIDLVHKAHKEFPNHYSNYTDLEILADIQHNGGATCLVDFSKNLLTALWFACHNEKDDGQDGFLFCYNIMEDIKNNNLEYVSSLIEKKKIEKILLGTYRYTNYSSEIVDKFCLWEPTNLNDRIVRQDSVFLFGTESFMIWKHDIFTICIPCHLKKKIRGSLAILFNMSSENMYKDYVGLASSNAKSILMPNALRIGKGEDEQKKGWVVYKHNYSLALAYINNGNYSSALAQLKKCEKFLGELESVNQYNFADGSQNKRKIEVHFNLGKCYSSLKYFDNAIAEYEYVKTLSLKEINGLKQEKERPLRYYYSKKCIEAYNLLIDLMYDTRYYDKAYSCCKSFVHQIDIGMIVTEQEIDTNVSVLSMLELQVLAAMCQNTKIDPEMLQKANQLVMAVGQNSYIGFLASYYAKVCSLLLSTADLTAYVSTCSSIKDAKGEIFRQKEKLRYYIEWHFLDMQDAIEQMSRTNKDEWLKYICMKEMLALVISVRDLYKYLNDEARN